MNYTEARAYIDSMERFGIKPGLERITKMLAYLGNPQDKLQFVHVAGTNGKGSVSTMIASILSHEGYRTGLFTSPYVLDFRERFMVNGTMITEDEFAEIMTKVSTVNDILAKSGCCLTQFEVITAVAMLWFVEKNCRIVVLECGLGGRLDSTNVIKEPLCSVITKISMDHTDILGDTVAKIAVEKAGIIKQGCPVVLAPNQCDEAMAVIAEKCAEMDSALTICTTDAVKVQSMTPTVNHIYYGELRLMIPFAGSHQIENAVTAVNAARVLIQRGLSIKEENIAAGIAAARIPARFEVISGKPLVILDGAHNPDGIEALCNSIDTLLDGRSIIGIIGMLGDKEYENSLSKIIPRFSRVFTVTPDSPRALSAKSLAECAEKFAGEDVAVKSFENLKKAAEKAIEMADETSAVVVCGSLYLASAIRPILIDLLKDKN
ncbi:MAG: bifunctional folylpolyglutamate synthase/dihydrofolate synthase [Firmicutes bacterium]|nr:bifunctional folylpolyglutamate synthase/dihydrofolate synthase [Bacillota bacterium]